MSNKKENIVQPEVKDVDQVIRTPEDLVEPKVEPRVEEKPVTKLTGFVANCPKLNVRKTPSLKADVVEVISANTKVIIDEAKSTADWYKVRVKGTDGFCMKKYITVK